MTQNSYQQITLTANIVLSWPTSFGTGPVVCDINDVKTNTNGYTITMPNATLVPKGTSVIFNNTCTDNYSFEILPNGSDSPIATLNKGTVYILYISDNGTTTGTWEANPYGGGATTLTSFVAKSTGGSINITNGNVPTDGTTINFELPTSISNINTIPNKGLAVIDSVTPLTWSAVSLIGGTNIEVQYGDGSADPVISLNSSVSGLTSLVVGNFTITGTEITNTTSGGNIGMSTESPGVISLNGVTIDSTGKLTASTFSSPLTPKAWCVFTDTAPSNTINIQSSANVASVVRTSNGTYTINFTTPMSVENYGVLISLGNTDTLPRVSGTPSTAFWTSRNESYVIISVVDASGTPVPSDIYGITVLIMSST